MSDQDQLDNNLSSYFHNLLPHQVSSNRWLYFTVEARQKCPNDKSAGIMVYFEEDLPSKIIPGHFPIMIVFLTNKSYEKEMCYLLVMPRATIFLHT